MASFKNNPAFFTSLLCIGAVTLGQGWLIYSQRAEAERLTKEVAQKQQLLQNFSFSNPFPSKENAASVEKDKLQAEKTLAEVRKVLQATSELAEKLANAKKPAASTDAFFDLASFVERMRANYAQAGITVPAESWFGFATYSSTGPVKDLIDPVFKQRQHVEYLLDSLLIAKPREIRAVERTRPLTEAQKAELQASAGSPATPVAGSSGDKAEDFFTIDPRTSAKLDGFVSTDPFRITFTGTTDVLRAFLNELALFKLPVVVRSVEVESIDKSGSTPSARPPTPAPSSPFGLFGQDTTATAPVEVVKPIIEQIDSVFVVTVEFIQLVDKSGPAANTP